jgi:hypothetical protein
MFGPVCKCMDEGLDRRATGGWKGGASYIWPCPSPSLFLPQEDLVGDSLVSPPD